MGGIDRLLTLALAWMLGMGLYLLARESLGPVSSTLLRIFPAGIAILCASVVAQALAGSRWSLQTPASQEGRPPIWPESPGLRLLVDLVALGLGLGGVAELLRGEGLLGGGLIGLLVVHLLVRVRGARAGSG